MKVTLEESGALHDVICDMCGESTYTGTIPSFGTLRAEWGPGSLRCGEAYELHLCEECFFVQLQSIKRTRWAGAMFEADPDSFLLDTFGRVEFPKPAEQSD